LLAVKIQRLGHAPTIRVVLPEISIEEVYTLVPGQLTAHLDETVVLLMGADKQGGGEGIKAPAECSFRRLAQAKRKAILAALSFTPGYLAEILLEVITPGYYERKVHFLSQGLHGLEALLVLQVGVDIGVVPQSTDLVSLPAPVVNGIGSTVGTAAMNQNRPHSLYHRGA